MQISSCSAREIYTMDAKSVLVHFKDYCRVYSILPSEGQSELDSLIEAARKAFQITDEDTIRYDLDWNEYIDLDKNSTFQHKDKLRAVTHTKASLQNSSLTCNTESSENVSHFTLSVFI